ncbi:MAG: tetratricopeptide repeat protein [Hyphomicrobiaceae bacterium]
MALVRCSEGHVFDVSLSACPTCGEAVATIPSGEQGAKPRGGIEASDQEATLPRDRVALGRGLSASWLLPALTALTLAVFALLLPVLWPEPPIPGSSRRPLETSDRQASAPVKRPSDERPSNAVPNPATSDRIPANGEPVPDVNAEKALAALQPPFKKPVPPASDNDGPNYAAYAAEVLHELSPLSRELLATSRGYFAFTRKDYSEARAWLNTRAAKSNPAAMYWLGVMTERGNGVAQSHVEALRLISASAAAGFQPAQMRLAAIYLHGEYPGVPKDRARARELLLPVAKEVLPAAAKLIEEAGLTPKDIGATMVDFGKLLNRSESEAFKMALELHRQNVGSARYWVGNLALAGNGSGMSRDEALALIREAARIYTSYAIDKLARLAAYDGSANLVEAAVLGHLARINSPSDDEIEVIERTLKPTVRSLSDEKYRDLRVLLSGIVELPHRW